MKVAKETANWGDFLLSDIENFIVDQDKVAIWFMSDSCFVIKTPKCILYTDPYFGGSFPETGGMRMTCLPLEPSLISEANVVLFTHEHDDHCHKESVLPFNSNTEAFFVGPKPVSELMEKWSFNNNRIKLVKPGDTLNFEDVEVAVTNAHDPFSDGAVTYIIRAGKITLFHTGDSRYFEGFLQIGKEWDINIAFINFGKNPPGKQYFMTPSDFFRTAQDLRAKKAVPMHWDIFKSIYQDPIILNDLQKYEQNKVDILIMRMGDKIILP